ncbi:MAG TPA: hypothetical protein EYM84_02280 [Flavobacteriales bacterium]|nr:hypothetical protein [Flavobacteriales bacterium]
MPKNTRASRTWFRQKAKFIRTSPRRIMRETSNKQTTTLKGRTMLGNMYCFFYDPKLSKSLSYYDSFPLVIPIKDYPDGFLGLNMHYLPPELRAKFMDVLYETMKNVGPDQPTDKFPRQRISYEALNTASRYKYFKPCLKRYLSSNVRSRYLKIERGEWDMALFLPTERFEKSSRRKVWKESRTKVNGI